MHPGEITNYFVGIALLLGVALQILSHRLHVPAIVPLLIGGILIGPESLGLIDPTQLDPTLFKFIISMAVAIILFEGGLGLDIQGFKQSPFTIRRLLTIGVCVTWLGTASLIHFIGNMSWDLALLAGSLVIVTGPTVIQPILRKILVKEKLHHILLWESVLIDPIGVFIAILCLELFIHDSSAGISVLFFNFGLRFLLGLILGIIGGFFLVWLLNPKRIKAEHVNISALGTAIFLFGLSDWILPESGLLTVTVAGFILGAMQPPRLRQVTQFKRELTDLAVAVLFILLAANLEFSNFSAFLDNNGLWILVGLLLLVRPLSIFTCTIGRSLTFSDKVFLSWMAPRGVVAASMASLFAIAIEKDNPDAASFIQAFVFSVIGVSVIIQGGTAGIVAHISGVSMPKRKGWLIVGAHRMAREMAIFIQKHADARVYLVDTNSQEVKNAQEQGLSSEVANATDTHLFGRDIVVDIGNMLAVTNNSPLNKIACQIWSEILPVENLYRWSSEHDDINEQIEDQGHPVWNSIHNPNLFSYELDSGKAKLITRPPEALNNSEQVKFLLCIDEDGNVCFTPPKDYDPETFPSLYLYRRSLNLVHLTRSEFIKQFETMNRDDLLRSMVDDVVKVFPQINKDELIKNLINREMSFSTAIGNSVAIPHAYCSDITESICFIAQVPSGMDFKSPIGQPVRLVFMLISPPGDPEHHLKILGQIANLASDSNLVDSLVSAPGATDVIVILENSLSNPTA